MTDKLKAYRAKRDFSVTNEPEGMAASPSRRKLRFSVQHHAARSDHYDLRLELGGVALSWAVPKGPSYAVADKRLAVRVEDHPVDYMDFEGVIPKGEYGGGTVMLWDEGVWTPRTDPKKGLAEGSLKFRLDGKRLKGDWALVKIKKSEEDAWLLIKERDGYEKKTAGISRFTKGVRSELTMTEIAKAKRVNPFRSAEVMLAERCEALPSDMGWVYELKYDGHRTLGFVEGGKTVLKTRNGHDCTATFLAAAEALSEALPNRAAVVDGEMVVAGKNGVPDFSALQAYAKGGKKEGLCYVLFDLLALDGEDLRDRPLTERKQKLKALFKTFPPALAYSEHTPRMTKRGVEAIRKRGMEGIVAKRAGSAYTAGKNGDWRKLKFRNSEEFVIGGYTESVTGELRSLLVGAYREGELVFAGSVGTGFKDGSRREIKEELQALASEKMPFSALPERSFRGAVWTRPERVAQVEFAEMTSSGLLRQASFKGMRRDKSPREVVEESPRPKPSRPLFGITHPEKIMFPDCNITKLDLAAYYEAVSARMLPYLKGRQLSLVCCPSGVTGEAFFRKHLDAELFCGVKQEEEGFSVTTGKGILSLVQYNAVEFHIRGEKKGRCDLMVFDLDPDEGLPLKEVKRGVRDVKRVLDELLLRSFLKTSGGKGYHIVVPLRGAVEPQTVRDFSKRVVRVLESAHPERYTSSVSKQARKGKIFIDWQRNSPGATSAAPYSVRARAGAPVSCPIAWEELTEFAPDSLTVRSVLRRLKQPDPWADFFTERSSLRPVLQK